MTEGQKVLYNNVFVVDVAIGTTHSVVVIIHIQMLKLYSRSKSIVKLIYF
jgi:hypothetical protein